MASAAAADVSPSMPGSAARKRPREESADVGLNESAIPMGFQRVGSGADTGILGDRHLGGDAGLCRVGKLGHGS